ncbi:MAG: MBL fold metallo-hydrolase [Verrucomicrobia bacterium]|nr:MBL fold metallo-hydrolase [Verrucomicrobiota bacterium]
MKSIQQLTLGDQQAALWFLGQAGYIIRSAGVTMAIDPYLSDAAAASAPEFSRLLPVPIEPEELRVDLWIVTHDHLDHLDPETIRRYPHSDRTQFLAPRQAARKLESIGVPRAQIQILHAGEEWSGPHVTVRGVFALPTGADVLDTTGYLLTFANGRSVYHSSDTGFTPLLLEAAPRAVEVLLVPINGKWGNLNVEQAIALTVAVGPRLVLPNHYDLMALNAENPETFRWLCRQRSMTAQCVIPTVMQPLIWE